MDTQAITRTTTATTAATSQHSSDDEEQLSDVSLELNVLNSTLLEQSSHDISHYVNLSSLFLKELLMKQEESHRKIQELQKTIQTKGLKSSALPALSHSLRSPGTSLYEDQDGDTESSVSLERYMVKETGVEHENENINEGQQGNYERKRNHSIDSITTLGSYRELNLTQDGATNNTFGDQKQLIQLQKTSSLRKTFGVVGIAANSTEEAKSGNVERSEINNSYSTFNWLDAKLAFIDKEEISEVEDESSLNGNEDVLAWCSGINKLNDQRNTSFESLESNTTTIEQKQQSRQLNDENEISRRFPEELFGEKTPNKIVTASIEKRYEKINERKETRHSGNVNDAKATHLKLERDTETQQNLEHNRKSTKSQENKNTEAKNTPQEDELILCIDMMAAHMKELELEKERVKLDVIVALRRRFDSLLLNNRIMDSGERNEGSGDGGKEVPAQFFEELNDSLYDITLDEVTRIKREEREKQQRIEEGYQLQVQKLSKELESLAQQKCELLVEISNCKEKTRFLEDRQGKHERAENRTVYLESLLRNVENENAKLKTKVEALENEALEIQQQNRTLTSSVKDLKHKLELSTSAEESTTQFYNAEHEKLLDDNKRAKDELFELQNQLESLRQEKQRIVNSKETDISIIKHLEEKLKRQGTLLENVSDDSNKHFETNLKLENKAAEYKQKLKKCAFGIESTQHENKKLQEENASLEREKSDLKKTVGELKQRELEHSFELSMQKADFERKQSSWNSQREHLERKLKLLLASAESNAVAIHNSNNAHNSRIDAQKTVSFKHSLFNSSNDFHTTINTKPQISRNEPFINQSLLSDSTDFHTTTTKPQISRSEPFINQSIFSDSNSIIHNNSNMSFRKNETQNTILHSYNHGLSLGDVVTSSSKNKMVDEAAVQNPYAFDHSITNHSHLANVNGQTTTNYLKKNSSSFPSYGVPSINSHNRDLFSNGNAPNHSKNAHFQNGINKSPPYNEYSTAQLLQKPVNGNERINSSVTSPAKESKTKVKYTADDTRMFLKEMSYKLEHTEATLKLADPDSTNSFFTSTSFDTLQRRINGLRNEVIMTP